MWECTGGRVWTGNLIVFSSLIFFLIGFIQFCKKASLLKLQKFSHVSIYPFFSLCKEVQRRTKPCCSLPLSQSCAGLQLDVWECNRRNYPCACPVFILFCSCPLLEESQVDRSLVRARMVILALFPTKRKYLPINFPVHPKFCTWLLSWSVQEHCRRV